MHTLDFSAEGDLGPVHLQLGVRVRAASDAGVLIRFDRETDRRVHAAGDLSPIERRLAAFDRFRSIMNKRDRK